MNNKWSENNLINIVKISKNRADTLRNLGMKIYTGNYETLNKYLMKYSIDISHFKRGNINNLNHEKTPLNKILIENSLFSRTHLKERLYKEGLKERFCEKCNQNEMWNGRKMSLILDHKNGINNDNRIENLRILCPNCNATLPTHCGKNIKDKRIKIKKPQKNIINYCGCGIKISKKSKKCINCHNMDKRKIKRPSIKTLLDNVNGLGYSATGRKYGVSDNTIRKWLK